MEGEGTQEEEEVRSTEEDKRRRRTAVLHGEERRLQGGRDGGRRRKTRKRPVPDGGNIWTRVTLKGLANLPLHAARSLNQRSGLERFRSFEDRSVFFTNFQGPLLIHWLERTVLALGLSVCSGRRHCCTLGTFKISFLVR